MSQGGVHCHDANIGAGIPDHSVLHDLVDQRNMTRQVDAERQYFPSERSDQNSYRCPVRKHRPVFHGGPNSDQKLAMLLNKMRT
jgi:hypothetical protein